MAGMETDTSTRWNQQMFADSAVFILPCTSDLRRPCSSQVSNSEIPAVLLYNNLTYAAPHMKAQGPVESGAVREYDDDELPWYDANINIESQSVRLHNEIVELTSLLQPTEEEDAQRLEAKKLLEDVVQQIFPGSSLQV
jgi:hypothetical protein